MLLVSIAFADVLWMCLRMAESIKVIHKLTSKRFVLIIEICWSPTKGFSFVITVTQNGKCVKFWWVHLLLKVLIFALFLLHYKCPGVLASITIQPLVRHYSSEGCSSLLAWSSAGEMTMTQMQVSSTVTRRPTSSSWSSMRTCSLSFRTWGRLFNSRYASDCNSLLNT